MPWYIRPALSSILFIRFFAQHLVFCTSSRKHHIALMTTSFMSHSSLLGRVITLSFTTRFNFSGASSFLCVSTSYSSLSLISSCPGSADPRVSPIFCCCNLWRLNLKVSESTSDEEEEATTRRGGECRREKKPREEDDIPHIYIYI